MIRIGAHVLDVIGGPVDEMPGPNRLAMVDKIGITVAGTGVAALQAAARDLPIRPPTSSIDTPR